MSVSAITKDDEGPELSDPKLVGGQRLRVAIVTESFLPLVNGVTNSVLRSCEQLDARGHEVLVIAPGEGPQRFGSAAVLRTPSVAMPGYREFRLGRPWGGLERALREFRPDVVHLASPAVLGAQAGFAARRLGAAAVAVYQTDLAGFAGRYGLRVAEGAVWRWLRHVHGTAQRNLAPSRWAVEQLRRNGIQRVAHWPRGVDAERFNPRHRDLSLRDRLAPNGSLLVGYVGRLAHEKEIELLTGVARDPRVRLVIVGDGPHRTHLMRLMPHATFLGFLGGQQLSTVFASLDVFVHPGSHETFCQAAQEALASGIPVVGPASAGLLDLVTPGETGYLFRPGSPESLHERVQLLAEDRTREAMGLAARRSVADRSWDAIGEQLVGHYREAINT
jgi:phosphatidylinositol alpha 1,6-mannosyltransferase